MNEVGSTLASFRSAMPALTQSVNTGSRSTLGALLPFTLALLFAVGFTSVAHAERVVVLRPTGELSVEDLDRVEENLGNAVRAAGHQALTDANATEVDPSDLPTTANEMRAVADMQQAQYVVTARATPQPEGYHLIVRVGYAPDSRVEELEAEVRTSREQERLNEIMAAMLRPEGLGDDAGRLAGDDTAARDAEAAAQQAAAEAAAQAAAEAAAREAAARETEEQARRDLAERERQRQEEDAAHAWTNRERYGIPASTMVHAGLGFRPLISHQANGNGGVLGSVELKVGRSFGLLPGFQLRGGLEVGFGAATGFGMNVGGVYLLSFFTDIPLHIGAGADVGFFCTTTGSRRTSLMLRVGPVVSWHMHSDYFLEAEPEFMFLMGKTSAATFGASVRIGRRF